MAQRIKIDGLADAVMKELTEYADLATMDMKAAVKKAGTTVKKEIQATAPKDTGAYSKSWSVKNTKETSNALEVTVYSRTSLSTGTSFGIWPCQAWRRPCGWSRSYCSGRRSRNQRTGSRD